jgi:hypothetical protein
MERGVDVVKKRRGGEVSKIGILREKVRRYHVSRPERTS